MAYPPHRTDLAGLTVIDLTSMIAGPTCTRLFAELGADVIHVEPPAGDDGRNTTSPFLGREGIFYSVGNRSKRGICLDLTRHEGREALLRLVERADLFVENTRPGALDALGLGYQALSARNPRLVYLSISGWGQRGPMASQPGYDVLVQAFSGAMVFPANGDAPVFASALIGDPTAPLLGAFAALAALRTRDATGRGAHVTTSLLQGALHLLGTTNVFPQDDPDHASRPRAGLPGGSGVFPTTDGRVVVCAWTDAQFRKLCDVAEVPHLASDPAHATRSLRVGAAGPLNEIFGGWTAAMSTAALLGALEAAGIPCSPVNRGLASLLDHPHAAANDLFVAVEHPDLGRLWQAGTGFEIDGGRGDLRPAPLHGADTAAVLREFGFDEAEVAALFASGAAIGPRP